MHDEGEDQEVALENDEVIDIITNYLACQSSVPSNTITKAEKIIEQYCSDAEIQNEKHYEFYFNLS